MSQFYRTRKTDIISPDGIPIFLRGVNFGGWLMMEGYILHALNLPVAKFKKEFAQALGKRALRGFEESFNDTFIREEDFQFVAKTGFNSLRVPFHYRLIEQKAYQYDPDGVAYLDRVLKWGKKYGLGIILDLHAAPGSQNQDWHSDSDGKAGLWKSPSNQNRVFALWEFLADRYKDDPTVLGYDLLNESVIDESKILNAFYKKLIRVIRSIDRNHMLFVEGNRWAQDVACLEDLDDGNIVASIHYYEPLEFTANFVPNLYYPLKSKLSTWAQPQMKKRLEEYVRFSRKYQRPIHVGEFGVNYRQGLFGEDVYLRDGVSCFKEFGFHWNYWTYKAIKNSGFPDGLFSYYPNPPWVNRQGPKLGWDTYAAHWPSSTATGPSKKKEMIKSWRTDRFTLNTKVFEVLKNGI